MLKTLVKVVEVVAVAAALAFVVLLLFNPNDPAQLQEGAATYEGEEAVAANDKAVDKTPDEADEEQNGGDEGDDEETTTTEADEEGNGDGADGEALFADTCARCHGDDGASGFAPALDGQDDVDSVIEVVTDGQGSMPGFGGDLSDEEIDAIATYVVEEL
ncbi:MAG: c-type cytochrome [Acidimicrobiales bacterium]